MKKYVIRLDDACPLYNKKNWDRMEQILDKYEILPLVGLIPDCKDPDFSHYEIDKEFWEKVRKWKEKKWTFALHGYNHVFLTNEGGINPVNKRSEYAGVPFEKQDRMIRNGLDILKSHDINAKVFFAPAHTFDLNTVKALRKNGIEIISDTVANKPYSRYGITFVPQQSGRVRNLMFSLCTFCYHPNIMGDKDFKELEMFLKKNREYFVPFPVKTVKRKMSVYDKFLSALYFARRK